MTSASNPMITRCPKCGTAFRVTPSQLQSAKGSVRCGSCLNVFKAQDYIVASTPLATPKTTTGGTVAAATTNKPDAKAGVESAKSPTGKTIPTARPSPTSTAKPAQTIATPLPAANKSTATNDQPNILSAIKPLPIEVPKPSISTPASKPAPQPAAVTKPVIRTINKSSLATDDILISDDMEASKSEKKSYDFDGFLDIDMAPKAEVSLFERKIRNKDDDDEEPAKTDESWAEMLIEDEDEPAPTLTVIKARTEEQLADDELFESRAINVTPEEPAPIVPATTKPTPPGLVFSLVGEKDTQTDKQASSPADDFVLSEELERIPSNQGFSAPGAAAILDPGIFETPDEDAGIDQDAPKRQVKTQPKIRSYDGSRTALLMNIIPAPIEFSAKRMRRWYQRKLWPTLSLLGLLALIVQVGWFKFDYFSRVEPYRTGYVFLCPYLGCQVPTLVDTSRILASNLVVREHPDTQGALAVDVMLINGAPFEQPFPDLLLVFTDIDQNQVASRRFTPKDYLGGELVGRELMPQNQKIHVTLDLVDPGAEAVNYHISIPRQ